MPTQLQLEGPDLETLLSRVKAEHGPGARIVRAEKVRTGGVAGFFAKERFEICVELDLAAGAPTRVAPLLDMTEPARASAPTSLLDLADQVSAAERFTQAVAAGDRAASEHPGRRASDRPWSDSLAGNRPAGTGRGDDAAAGARTPQPSTTQRRSTDRPADERVGEQRFGDVMRAAAASAPELPPAAVSTETTSFAAILARLGVAAGPADEQTTPAAAPSAGPTPEPVAEPVAATALPALPRQRTAPEPGTAVSVRRTAEVAVHGVERTSAQTSPVCGQLVQLGLPEHLLPEPAAGPVYPSLVQSLRRLPKVPRATNRAGGVLVVVGPQALALEVAREIARDLRLPVATAVVLATARRGRAELPAKQVVRTPAAAAERRAGWRRRRNLTVVAVDAPLTAAGAATARAFLTALQPSATWGVVEATRKAHDVGSWTRALGGVDALALTAVEETADPAAVLTLGIPVGRLGATKATPAAWAALLTDRMAA